MRTQRTKLSSGDVLPLMCRPTTCCQLSCAVVSLEPRDTASRAESRELKWWKGIVVESTVRGSGSGKPSPLGSRGSTQGILDVINLWRPVIVGEVEDEALSVLCETRDRQTDRQTDRRTDGRTDGRTDRGALRADDPPRTVHTSPLSKTANHTLANYPHPHLHSTPFSHFRLLTLLSCSA